MNEILNKYKCYIGYKPSSKTKRKKYIIWKLYFYNNKVNVLLDTIRLTGRDIWIRCSASQCTVWTRRKRSLSGHQSSCPRCHVSSSICFKRGRETCECYVLSLGINNYIIIQKANSLTIGHLSPSYSSCCIKWLGSLFDWFLVDYITAASDIDFYLLNSTYLLHRINFNLLTSTYWLQLIDFNLLTSTYWLQLIDFYLLNLSYWLQLIDFNLLTITELIPLLILFTPLITLLNVF